MRHFGLLALLILVAACAAAPPGRDSEYCARLFDQLEAIERTAFVPVPFGAPDFRQTQLARIRQAGCLTLTRDLVGMEELGRRLTPRAPAPGATPWLAAVQAGVVTSMADDARAQAFFDALGYRARSVGSPGLGRKIYVEATTLDEQQEIVSIARRAGFVGPYVSRYVTF